MDQRTLFDVSEADVRSWSDSATFARGDALQTMGHVLAPRLVGTQMTADVLGTWSRVEKPTLQRDGSNLALACTCGAPAPCDHAVAMMLQWARDPGTFSQAATERSGVVLEVARGDESPEEELEELLYLYTMPDLRALAKRRGLAIKATLKQEFVERLAAQMVRPESIDAALAGVGEAGLLLLVLMDVLRGSGDTTSTGLRSAFQALWRRRQAEGGAADQTDSRSTLDRLEHLGLVVRPPYYGGFVEPMRAVSRRLPVPKPLLDFLPDRSDEPATRERDRDGLLTPLDLMQMLAREIRQGDVRAQVVSGRDTGQGRPPAGWEIVPRTGGEPATGAGKALPGSVQLRPDAGAVTSEARRRLADGTGATPDHIEFVAELMSALGVLQPPREERAAVRIDAARMRGLLMLDAVDRSFTLVLAWLSLPAASDLRLLSDILDVRVAANQVGWFSNDPPLERSLREVVARLVGHLAAAPPRWYSHTSLADLCATIAPGRLYRSKQSLDLWCFTLAGRPDKPLRLNTPEGRQQVYRTIVRELVRGPLAWLGMVDVVAVGEDLLFRPRRLAAILADRDPGPIPADAAAVSLLIEAEEDGTPIMTVSFSGEDEMARSLTAMADRLPASSEGMRFRLTGRALQYVFEARRSASDVIAWMEGHSKNGVPRSVRQRIESAWVSFGTVRLYDDLTLVELGDDFVRRELDATAGLSDAAIHVFSPRLIAVSPDRLPALLTSLGKAGYRPRVLEGT
jgi:hypothetical protein